MKRSFHESGQHVPVGVAAGRSLALDAVLHVRIEGFEFVHVHDLPAQVAAPHDGPEDGNGGSAFQFMRFLLDLFF